jgi:hypothetical protein
MGAPTMMSSRLEKNLPYNEIFYPAIGLFFCHNKSGVSKFFIIGGTS